MIDKIIFENCPECGLPIHACNRIAIAEKLVARSVAILSELLSTAYAEDCQECAISQTEAWAKAKDFIKDINLSAQQSPP